MPTRLITPSQLSLFSISPLIGAWWEELEAISLCNKCIPEMSAALKSSQCKNAL